jgi:queuine tRNA-ribosyltransferase
MPMTDTSKKPDKLETLATIHGELVLPSFLPDATRAVVRTIDSRDIKNSGSRGVMVNVIHLGDHPGISIIKQVGGIHKFMNWDGHVFCDSGGFQVFSLRLCFAYARRPA